MSNYTITTDFGAKDSLPSSNSAKVVRGSEFTTEFTNIQTAIATKADTAGDTFTGVVNFSADVAVNTNTLFVDVSEAKVGIGTASPAYALDVTGSAQLSGGDLILRSDSDNADTQYIRFENYPSDIRTAYIRADYTSQTSGGGTALAFGANDHATATDTDSMVIDIEGNVGIGTDSPSLTDGGAGLVTHISDDTRAALRLTTTGGGGDLELRTFSSNGATIFNSANGELRLGTNATERMRIDPSGNVLVGTTTQFGTDGISLNQSGWFYVRRTSDKAATFRLDGNDGNMITFDKEGSTVGSIGTNSGYLRIGTGDTHLLTHSGIDSIIPYSGSANRDAAIDLGYSGARFKDLHLSGAGYIPDVRSTSNQYITHNDGNFLAIRNSSGAERMRIDSSGKVGIGTTSPEKPLHVNAGTGNIGIRVESTDTEAEIEFMDDATTGTSNSPRIGGKGNDLFMQTNGVQRMRIDSSGHLMVGTTSTTPSDGGFTFMSGSVGHFRTSHATGTPSGNWYQAFYLGSSVIGSITQAGTTGVNYNTSSDERLKENIADSADAGSKVDAIQIRQFDWIADGTHQDYGVIAQELVTVAPEAVHQPEDSEEMMGVDYSKLVPMLIKEVQSLRSRVAELENA